MRPKGTYKYGHMHAHASAVTRRGINAAHVALVGPAAGARCASLLSLHTTTQPPCPLSPTPTQPRTREELQKELQDMLASRPASIHSSGDQHHAHIHSSSGIDSTPPSSSLPPRHSSERNTVRASSSVEGVNGACSKQPGGAGAADSAMDDVLGVSGGGGGGGGHPASGNPPTMHSSTSHAGRSWVADLAGAAGGGAGKGGTTRRWHGLRLDVRGVRQVLRKHPRILLISLLVALALRRATDGRRHAVGGWVGGSGGRPVVGSMFGWRVAATKKAVLASPCGCL